MPFQHSCWTILVLATCIIFHSLAESTVNPQAVSRSGDINNKSHQDKPIEYILRHCSKTVGFPLTFLATNYISHAFTIRFKPGFGPCYTILFGTLGLCFRYFDLVLACRSMEYLAIFKDSPLKTAIKSGLCAVARMQSWRPEPGDKIWCLPFVPRIPKSN